MAMKIETPFKNKRQELALMRWYIQSGSGFYDNWDLQEMHEDEPYLFDITQPMLDGFKEDVLSGFRCYDHGEVVIEPRRRCIRCIHAVFEDDYSRAGDLNEFIDEITKELAEIAPKFSTP